VFAAACIVVWLLGQAFQRSFRGSTKGLRGVKLPHLVGPLRLLIFTLLVHTLSQFSPTLVARTLWTHIAASLTVVGFCWLLMRLVDTFAELMTQRMEHANARAKVAVVHLLRAVFKPLIVAIGIAVILSLEGVNTTAIITSLGVGGIAIAFAAQKTIENLFGGISIIGDRPVLVGDFCRFGSHMGTVMHIGLRSTQVRTLDRTILSVPNGQFSSVELENFSARDKIRFQVTLNLRRDTTLEQVQRVLITVQDVLTQHAKVETGAIPVRFIGIGKYSLDIEVFAYVTTSDYDAFLEIQQELLLGILRAVERAGASLAVPLLESSQAQAVAATASR
jgi:MscS family membrane protein